MLSRSAILIAATIGAAANAQAHTTDAPHVHPHLMAAITDPKAWMVTAALIMSALGLLAIAARPVLLRRRHTDRSGR